MNKKAAELAKNGDALLKSINGAMDSSSSTVDGLADEDSNLMVKLKFLTYKVPLSVFSAFFLVLLVTS
jgi:hypothetical protein